MTARPFVSVPEPAKYISVNGPLAYMAATMRAEARGEGEEGLRAVGCVIINRSRNPRWWGHDITSVCTAPWQFSCWNPQEPSRPLLARLSAGDADAQMDVDFQCALVIAKDLVLNYRDITGNADCYANLSLVSPNWADPSKVTVVIGHHTFFALELKPSASLAESSVKPSPGERVNSPPASEPPSVVVVAGPQLTAQILSNEATSLGG